MLQFQGQGRKKYLKSPCFFTRRWKLFLASCTWLHISWSCHMQSHMTLKGVGLCKNLFYRHELDWKRFKTREFMKYSKLAFLPAGRPKLVQLPMTFYKWRISSIFDAISVCKTVCHSQRNIQLNWHVWIGSAGNKDKKSLKAKQQNSEVCSKTAVFVVSCFLLSFARKEGKSKNKLEVTHSSSQLPRKKFLAFVWFPFWKQTTPENQVSMCRN